MKFACSTFGVLLVAAAAQAGIYNTTETDDIRLSTDISQFRDTLVKVRSIGFDKVDFDNILRKRYLLNEALGGTTPPAGLTLEQKLDYSAVLLRRKKFQQAIDFLTPIARKHPEIFLFDCHLAMAYWLSGQQGNDRRAIEILSQALSKKSWPENFHDLTDEQRNFLLNSMGWNEGPYDFYRTAELHLLKLMKKRLAEPAGTPFETVDAIFDGKGGTIKFVNDDGKFEPGRVATNQIAKLPPRALEIVEQLLLWLPEDLRLYWLLGEIANSQWTPEDLKRDAKNSKDILKREQAFNNLKAANTIFKELIDDFQVRAKDLRERRQIMRDYVQTVEPPQVTFDVIEKTLDDADKKATPGVPMTTRTMAITFAAGMAVGIFAVWQFQEIRRRRRGG